MGVYGAVGVEEFISLARRGTVRYLEERELDSVQGSEIGSERN